MLNKALQFAEEEGVDVEIYELKDPNKGLHSDNVIYRGNKENLPDMGEYEVVEYSYYDRGDLNETLFANFSDKAEEDLVIIIVARKDLND
jgi:hypothetical protein